MARLCFMRWVLWHILCNVAWVLDRKAGMDYHWTWSIYPQESVDYLVRNFGCIMRYAEQTNSVWIVDLIR